MEDLYCSNCVHHDGAETYRWCNRSLSPETSNTGCLYCKEFRPKKLVVKPEISFDDNINGFRILIVE